MTLSTICLSIIYLGGKVYWWRKQRYPEKSKRLTKASKKLYHIILYELHLAMSGFRAHTKKQR